MKKGIIKKTVMLGLGLVLAAGLVGCSGQNEDKKASDTNSKKEIVMGLDNTFVPMGFLNDKNELEGFDIDLAKEAFKRAGYTVKFQNIDWSMKEQALDNGNVDCLWNGYSITEERKARVSHTSITSRLQLQCLLKAQLNLQTLRTRWLELRQHHQL